ncbi:MAG: DUF1232 domain-containing protein [Gemmatimonadetes bacterium]|nr:DUF1232 domain-containing protein [Gemmatimonadota bacterium]NIR80994.1 DUF1232 domain-containing protein [Gemmatimonadota bacterium]NIT86399.1 DUF1232 domain-containing protein [Gemmatimonadota bacterium]NIU30236.1 DUF1232 domain-containing protein [Gemmatimonadota bacterium]NIU35142.1 DUF1232 domain-containing protein [Gemmatimonadota bacterium]
MPISDIQAVIESAKARGRKPLQRFLRRRMPDASEERIQEAVEVAAETIESVPILLARAAQEARKRGLESVVMPLLEEVERYFIRPVDLIPEMTQGLAGLLDDTYLVLRMLQGLEQGPRPFLDWDLDEPVELLRSFVGQEIARKLDSIALAALTNVSGELDAVWEELAQEA